MWATPFTVHRLRLSGRLALRGMGRMLSVALCLALVALTMQVPALGQCPDRHGSMHKCMCKGICTCCRHATHANAMHGAMHSVRHNYECSACFNGRSPVDCVGLMSPIYRDVHVGHSSVALRAWSFSGTPTRRACAARPQSSLSQIPAFLRECSLLS